MTAEPITPPCAHHGEGPVWDTTAHRMLWVDMLAGDILSTDLASGETHRLHVGSVAAAVRPRRRGGYVVAVERGFALIDFGSTEIRALPAVWTDNTVRMNDGGCDPQGRFYCGSTTYDGTPGRGALHRLEPDGSVTEVLTGVSVSNGLAWSVDGTTVYYIDTPTQRIDQFDFDPLHGGLTNRRPVVHIPDDVGAPDGLTVDAHGGLWVALWGGGAVHRYLPSGDLDHVIPIPATNVTACSFGGEDLGELYVTTSRVDAPPKDHATAGALFRVRPGISGAPLLTFAG